MSIIFNVREIQNCIRITQLFLVNLHTLWLLVYLANMCFSYICGWIVAAGITEHKACSADEVQMSTSRVASLFKRDGISFYNDPEFPSNVFMNMLQVMILLQRGNQNRTTEPTRLNETSSRSHAILQVLL